MLRKRAIPSSSGGTKQHEIAFDHGHGGSAAAAISVPKLFVSSSSGEASPKPQPEAVLMSPTSSMQTASATSPADVTCNGRSSGATAVPFSRHLDDNAGGAPDGNGQCKSHRPWDETRPVGLGLVGALNNDGEFGAPGDFAATAAAVLTGQRLRVKTNYYPPCSPTPCTEFGVKSGGGRVGACADSATDHLAYYPSPRRRCMSPREMMETSEDYTCVIARWPNPRTTHIFDNRVVESSGGYFPAELRLPSAGKDDDDDFLRYCHGCSKDLAHGKDIFMYRGEKAFCSRECRYHEMLFDEGIEKL